MIVKYVKYVAGHRLKLYQDFIKLVNMCLLFGNIYNIIYSKSRRTEQSQNWRNIWDTLVHFSGKEPAFTPPLHPAGSEFRQAVWQILLQIPYGQTTTYGEIARQLADVKRTPGMSAQAVGGAVGHNEVSIIIPCHRVVGTNGSLTGYAGGIDKKVELLTLEHTDMSRFFAPKKGTAL